MKSIRITFIILALLLAVWMSVSEPVIHAVNNPHTSASPCVIMKEKGRTLTPVTDTNDPLAKFLRAQTPCPTNVFALRSLLTAAGAKLKPTLVANRGFHNPKNNPASVQMMLFEIVSGPLASLGLDVKDGEFFFGHFITTNRVNLKVGDGVFIELIAWDSTKEVFNFYELTEDERGILHWLYRGDSVDIMADVTFLHRRLPPGQQKFGDRLR